MISNSDITIQKWDFVYTDTVVVVVVVVIAKTTTAQVIDGGRIVRKHLIMI